MIFLKPQRYFILSITHRENGASTSKIYNDLEPVKHLSIPFIPIKKTAHTTTPFFPSTMTNSSSTIQIALPPTIDHMKIFDMVKTVNHKLDVKLVGEQVSDNLSFEAHPENFGLNYFTLGEKYPGIGE